MSQRLTVIKIFISPTADTFYCATGGRMKMALQLQNVKHITEYLMNFADAWHGAAWSWSGAWLRAR